MFHDIKHCHVYNKADTCQLTEDTRIIVSENVPTTQQAGPSRREGRTDPMGQEEEPIPVTQPYDLGLQPVWASSPFKTG